MTAGHLLVELVVVLGTAAVITIVFEAMRLPVVLGYVLAGLVIGPHVPVPLVADAHLVHALSELGVILLMFGVGLELRLSRLAQVGVAAALTTILLVAGVSTVGALIAGLFGYAPEQAIFTGACLGISSTMLVAKAFEERGWKCGFVDVVFAILVFEDLVAIVLLVVLGGVASGAGIGARDLAITLAQLAGFLAAMVVGGLLVVPRLVRWVVGLGRSETIVIFALALCFGSAALADHAGYSVALGAFVAGVLIAESGHGETIFERIHPLRDVLVAVFFISIGMTIAPADLFANAPIIAALSAVVLLTKPLFGAIGVLFTGGDLRRGLRTGLALAQVGELSFVIANLAVVTGVAPSSLLAVAVGVACVTMITSAVVIDRSSGIADAVAGCLPRRVAVFESFYQAWLQRLLASRARRPHLRRAVRGLLVDTAALLAIAIGAVTIGARTGAALGLGGHLAIAVPLATVAVAIPFAIGVVRHIVAFARLLADEVVPRPAGPEVTALAGGNPGVDIVALGAVDLGRAPRRALALTIELALAFAVGLPLIAIVAPFASTGGLVLLVAIAILAIVTYRAIVDFDHHVRAGSELVLEMLTRTIPTARHAAEGPPPDFATLLPGFAGVASLRVPADSPAIGKTLAALDLRAKTGATVLAIARGEHGIAAPRPDEPLRALDVLGVAGSGDAIAAVRSLLASPTLERIGP